MNGICLNWQRVGTHPLLPLPLGSEHDDACSLVVRNHRAPINKIVEQKLHAYEIPANNDEDTSLVHYDNPREPEYLDYCGWSVMSRSTCEAPYTSYVTVLVVAPWDRTTADTWCKAAFDIKHHLDCELLWPYGVDIKVEIIAPELLGRNHFAPVTGRDDLDRDWELIRATIRRKIERYEQVRMAWNCIALFSHGIYKNTTRNPPTVYITIASTCDEYEWNWDLRKDLQEYLDQSGYGLNLCMEHCAVDSFGTMAVKEPEGPSSEILEFSPFATMNPYGKTVSMGAELSASTDIIMTHHEPIEARIELDEQDIMANV